MSRYFCYIHTQASMAPQLHVLVSEPGEQLAAAVREEIRSWPAYTAVEIYDENDRAILRFTRTAMLVPS
ncbi:hypothetical protein V7S57_11090 [Caulobacter sp. CCNWLY153]|uniref:Uncharacterized protein n=1 Tax=Caulobacter radicis TaxID=2172650 RepID=A0A2T9JVF1_9CAUL|nr:hypothetical protein [Caulobacter radicis]PVM84813.1 hypothetical protein DDF65_08210 [Caulobacter radicis]PVM87649.1 hypothetical protein DDF62_16125 [Caulobacter radicis]